MSKVIKLKKGYDIKLVGEAANQLSQPERSTTFALRPPNFKGLEMPKLKVKEGDEVKAGSPLFFSKYHPDILYTSPVSGEVVEINRGERRAILEVKILADSNTVYESFTQADPSTLSGEQVKENLMKSGTWPLLRQRPFNSVANPEDKPKAIFISGFDSAPLAPDYNFICDGKEEWFQAGINALAKLTEGKVYLSLNKKANNAKVFTQAQHVELNYFDGPHPAGNIGVQIHHLAPMNKGEVAWHVNPQDVLTIGRLFLEGKYRAEKVVALTGSEIASPAYYETMYGAAIESLVKDQVKSEGVRYISGNVLTGETISGKGYLGFYDSQITVIPEGTDAEFMGWILPSYARPSISKTFTSYLRPNKKYTVNTNMHGEERAFVVSGEYEKVLPMDVYPVFLLKAIMAEDLDAMEALGIYEVVEEDFALCEFVCTSKMPVQEILGDGLELMAREG